ncbi:hypothetical protein Gmet_0908 [Geobacter metallireducens GS-15]|uniref:Outer membrane channel n=1 Tax=Geobacter metallireducens (strain ATCC 53774 / DSM 7210 / GS-15) TaxID=269799 RepID=Q39X74_GEOMG|nr:hypothetical protein [Geobacter metallireducens]ABB31150.1 hypothetical protein Gmet_0908 [Geobacter metallireducens GS-15]
MGIKWFTHILLLAGVVSASTGFAAQINGRSSTQLIWFNDYYSGRQVELVEYLRLSVTKIDEAGKFSLYGYGRGSQDLNNGDGLNGRLYYLYADYRGLFDKVDFRLGRQFVNNSAGTALVDGGQIDLRNIGPIGFNVFGGRDVVFGINGEAGHSGNYAMGLSAYLSGFRNTDLDVSWFRKWDDGDVSRDILGASFKQYLFNRLKLYGNARYDVTAEVFNEVLGGVKYFPMANLIFTGEWYQSYPTFDTTSIYSVFAVNRYQEGVFRVDYTINDMIAVNAGYSRQDYGDDGIANVYELGCRLHPISSVEIGLAYDKRNGYGGKLDGGQLDVAWDVTKGLQLSGGLTYDVYQRDFYLDGSSRETAQKYWLGGKYKLARNLQASLRVEDAITARDESDINGRFVLDYDF